MKDNVGDEKTWSSLDKDSTGGTTKVSVKKGPKACLAAVRETLEDLIAGLALLGGEKFHLCTPKNAEGVVSSDAGNEASPRQREGSSEDTNFARGQLNREKCFFSVPYSNSNSISTSLYSKSFAYSSVQVKYTALYTLRTSLTDSAVLVSAGPREVLPFFLAICCLITLEEQTDVRENGKESYSTVQYIQ